MIVIWLVFGNGGSFLEMLSLVMALLASYATAGTLNPACAGRLGALPVIIASISDLNSIYSKIEEGGYYDPNSDTHLRSVPLTKLSNGKMTNELYIFDPKSQREGITVETDGKIKAVEISAYPDLNKNLGLAISDKNLFLFNPADGKMIRSFTLEEMNNNKIPIFFHDEENPRDVFIVEKDHVQVISREAGMIYHDIVLSQSFRPKKEGVINKTIQTPTGGLLDLSVDDTKLILRNSRGGEIFRTIFLKDIVFPYDSNIFVDREITLGLFLDPEGTISLVDRKSKVVILKFQKTPFKVL